MPVIAMSRCRACQRVHAPHCGTPEPEQPRKRGGRKPADAGTVAMTPAERQKNYRDRKKKA